MGWLDETDMLFMTTRLCCASVFRSLMLEVDSNFPVLCLDCCANRESTYTLNSFSCYALNYRRSKIQAKKISWRSHYLPARDLEPLQLLDDLG